MQARHLMLSKLKLTLLQDLRLSYKSQSLFSMAVNAQRMAHVALLSKDLSEIKAKFKLWKVQKILLPVELLNLKNSCIKCLRAQRILQLKNVVNQKQCRLTTSEQRVICLALHPIVVELRARIIMIGNLSELVKFGVRQLILVIDRGASEVLSIQLQRKEKTSTLLFTQRSIVTYWPKMLLNHHRLQNTK